MSKVKGTVAEYVKSDAVSNSARSSPPQNGSLPLRTGHGARRSFVSLIPSPVSQNRHCQNRRKKKKKKESLSPDVLSGATPTTRLQATCSSKMEEKIRSPCSFCRDRELHSNVRCSFPDYSRLLITAILARARAFSKGSRNSGARTRRCLDQT